MRKAEKASSTVENPGRLRVKFCICLFPVFTLRELVLTTLATSTIHVPGYISADLLLTPALSPVHSLYYHLFFSLIVNVAGRTDCPSVWDLTVSLSITYMLLYYYLTRTTVGACRLARHTKGRTI